MLQSNRVFDVFFFIFFTCCPHKSIACHYLSTAVCVRFLEMLVVVYPTFDVTEGIQFGVNTPIIQPDTITMEVYRLAEWRSSGSGIESLIAWVCNVCVCTRWLFVLKREKNKQPSDLIVSDDSQWINTAQHFVALPQTPQTHIKPKWKTTQSFFYFS